MEEGIEVGIHYTNNSHETYTIEKEKLVLIKKELTDETSSTFNINDKVFFKNKISSVVVGNFAVQYY
jgi:hypothetical protein